MVLRRLLRACAVVGGAAAGMGCGDAERVTPGTSTGDPTTGGAAGAGTGGSAQGGAVVGSGGAVAAGASGSATAGNGGQATAGTGGVGGTGPVNCDGVLTFADSNLESAVREGIGMPTGDIRSEDVSGLSELVATSQSVSNLSGIECLQGLTTLSLIDSGVSDLTPLSGLTGLTELNLASNRITDLNPLSGLTELRFLDLDLNTISDLAINYTIFKPGRDRKL